MSFPGPDGGNPFEGMPLFGDLAKLFQNQGPVNWELARQFAVWGATGGTAEANVDPLDRIKLEELARVAELHVADMTGLEVVVGGRAVSIAAVTKAEWAARTLNDWKPLLERLATGLGSGVGIEEAEGEIAADDPMAGFLGQINSFMRPTLLGMQVGALLGSLAQRAFGAYELPVPRPAGSDLIVVPANLATFADDWSLPVDDVRLWVAISELTHQAVLSLPHVRARLDALLGDYAAGFRPDPASLESKFGAIDPTNPQALESLFSDPTALLGAIQTDAQRAVLDRLAALVAAVEGYVDHVVDSVGRKLIGSFGPLSEALRRQRVERGDDAAYTEQLLGVVMDQATFDRGARFVDGVVERAGADGLARLWASEKELPTPAEVDAPGLWLARIDLPE